MKTSLLFCSPKVSLQSALDGDCVSCCWGEGGVCTPILNSREGEQNTRGVNEE